MLLTIMLILVAAIALAALEVWLLWHLGDATERPVDRVSIRARFFAREPRRGRRPATPATPRRRRRTLGDGC